MERFVGFGTTNHEKEKMHDPQIILEVALLIGI